MTIAAKPVPWREAVARAVRDPLELCRALELPEQLAAAAVRAGRLFPLFAPWEFIARMRRGDPDDPLLRQVLPLAEEDETPPGFTPDPLGEADAETAPGLLKKYHGRALMVVTGSCAVHCRYCFRRHFPYGELPGGKDRWHEALAQLAADPAIHEVLLSGGDPLTRSDGELAELVWRLAGIPHLRRLRVHTRLPIVIPQRVCDELLDWLAGSRLTPVVVVHANHPAEIDEPAAAALARLIDAGIPVLNQAVLLRGVNNSAAVLAELCERLADLRVVPYYLHQLDRVAGAAHFEVPIEQGRQIIEQLRRQLPGYAVPRYVREEPGAESKVVIA